MTSGEKLLKAAEIVFKSGQQLDAMMDCLINKTADCMKKECLITNIDNGKIYSPEKNWIVSSWIRNIHIYESTRKRNPSNWLAFMMTIYDEDDLSIFEKWEPSLYVMYGPGGLGEDWGVASFADEIREDEWELHKDGRIWLSASDEDHPNNFDCWFFALPLTELGNEEALQRFVVKPSIELIKNYKNGYNDIDLTNVLSENSPAFRYRREGEKVVIVR